MYESDKDTLAFHEVENPNQNVIRSSPERFLFELLQMHAAIYLESRFDHSVLWAFSVQVADIVNIE